MGQELGKDQDQWDGRIFQEQDGQYGDGTDPPPYRHTLLPIAPKNRKPAVC